MSPFLLNLMRVYLTEQSMRTVWAKGTEQQGFQMLKTRFTDFARGPYATDRVPAVSNELSLHRPLRTHVNHLGEREVSTSPSTAFSPHHHRRPTLLFNSLLGADYSLSALTLDSLSNPPPNETNAAETQSHARNPEPACSPCLR